MKKEAKEGKNPDKKVMTYININKRITELTKMELLEIIRPDAYVVNIHGRKDYKVTEKGLPHLIPHMIVHPDDIKDIVGYMKKTKLDEREFTKQVYDRTNMTIYAFNLYREITKDTRIVELPFDKEGQITAFKVRTRGKEKKH
jgi:hypothetical protein